MLFAQPMFLFAMAALAIPVIVHLFNFRRYRKVYFTNVRFITEINQESKRRSQLKHLLILLMRILAVASLVLAFSQPYIPSPLQKKVTSGKRAVSIYIDNSFSMEAISSEGRLLDAAKKRALEIADAFNPADLFQLLTCDFEGKHQRLVTRDEFRTLVQEVRITPATRSIPEVLRRQNDLLSTVAGNNRYCFLISDFQKSTSKLTSLKADTITSVYFIPLSAKKQNNIYIDSAWMDNPVQQPGSPSRIRLLIKNMADESMEKIPIKLTINGTQRAVASISAEAGAETMVELPFSNDGPGIQYGKAEIMDYPVTWDDTLYFSYSILQKIPVLSIYAEKQNPYLDALFQSDSSVDYRAVQVNHVDYSSFPRFPLILIEGNHEISTGLMQEMVTFTASGGNLVFIPTEGMNLVSMNQFLSRLVPAGFDSPDTTVQKIASLNLEDPLYADVFEKNAAGKMEMPDNTDFPSVSMHFPIHTSLKAEKTELIRLQNGQPFLVSFRSGKGRVYLFTSPFSDKRTGFMRHSIFVPTLYKMVLLSVPSQPFYYNIDRNDPVLLAGDSLPNNELYRIESARPGTEFIPEIQSSGGETFLYLHDQVRSAGFYYVKNAGKTLCGIAYNYSRKESDLQCFSRNEIGEQARRAGIKYAASIEPKNLSLTHQIATMNQGKPLWKLFIILALVFLSAEVAITLIYGFFTKK
jgi:hypothetical protein